jgi:Flp pilus assembly protein TadG
MTRRESGQALTEFAFVLPLFMLFVFSVIQLSLLFVAYYSETRMARETSRWLAVSSSLLDTDVAQHVSDTMLPGLVKSSANPPYARCTAAGVVIGNTTCTAASDNVNAYYVVGNMTLKFTACNPKTTSPTPAAPCLNTNRASGQTLYVEMTYNASNLVFLPTNFRLGWLATQLPTTLPPYRVSVMVE